MTYATVVEDHIGFIELDDDNLLGEWNNTPITKISLNRLIFLRSGKIFTIYLSWDGSHMIKKI